MSSAEAFINRSLSKLENRILLIECSKSVYQFSLAAQKQTLSQILQQPPFSRDWRLVQINNISVKSSKDWLTKIQPGNRLILELIDPERVGRSVKSTLVKSLLTTYSETYEKLPKEWLPSNGRKPGKIEILRGQGGYHLL